MSILQNLSDRARQVNVLSDLFTAPKQNGDLFITKGYNSAGDGGANEYIYHSSGWSGLSSPDGVGFYIRVGATDAYFEAVDKTVANVKQFGAKGDNTTNDYAAIQAAIDASQNVRLNNGDTYKISGTSLSLRDGLVIDGNAAAINLIDAMIGVAGEQYARVAIRNLNASVDAANTNNALIAFNFVGGVAARHSDITIENCSLDQNEEGNVGIAFKYIDKFKVLNCEILNAGTTASGGWGIHVDESTEGIIDGCIINNSARDAIQVFTNCVNIRISKNSVSYWLRRSDGASGVSNGAIDCYGPGNRQIIITENHIDTTATLAGGAGVGRHSAFRFAGTTDSILSNNTCRMRSGSMQYIISDVDRSGSPSTNNLIEGNTILIESDFAAAGAIFDVNAGTKDIIGNTIRFTVTPTFLPYLVRHTIGTATQLKLNNNKIYGPASSWQSFLDNTQPIENLQIIGNIGEGAAFTMIGTSGTDTIGVTQVIGNSFKTAHAQAFTVYPAFNDLTVTDNFFQATTNEFVFSGVAANVLQRSNNIFKPIAGSSRSDGLHLFERLVNPAAPAEGQTVIWQSDGTGDGGDGDLIAVTTAGAVTTKDTLVQRAMHAYSPLGSGTQNFIFNTGNGRHQSVQATGNIDLQFTATLPGNYTVIIEMDGTGGHTIGYVATAPTGTPPSIDTAPNAKTIIPLFWDGTTWFHV